MHEHHLTSAPNSSKVSIKTAVYIVICKDPVIRAPNKGFAVPNSSRQDINPGISTSAKFISFLPKSA